jgi:hypothetical protein
MDGDLSGRESRRRRRAALAAPPAGAHPRHDALDCGAQLRPVPPAGPQHDGGRAGTGGGEVVGPLGQVTGVGSAETERRGVRVARQQQVATSPHDRGQQARDGGGHLLRVVDRDEPRAPPDVGQQLGVVVECPLGRPHDERRVIGAGAAQCVDLVVLGEHLRGGHPLGPVVLAAQPGQVLRAQPAFDRAHHQVAQLGPQAPGAQCRPHVVRPVGSPAGAGRVSGEQLAEDDVLLRTGEQPGGRQSVGGRGATQDAEGQGRGRAGDRLARRAVEPAGDPLAQLGRRAPGRGQHEDLVRREAALLHATDDGLDDRGRDAGAGRAEQPQRPAAVGHRSQLLRVERGSEQRWPGGPQQAQSRRPGRTP